MARIETDPFYSSPTFSRATAGTDLFKKEDVQALAAAVSTHNHTTGKGAVLEAGSIPAGSITSGMIADATIDTADLKDGAVTSAKIADGTIATADHADASVTNAKLASDTARANLLTNGGFELWQRGNGPFAAHLAYIADQWQISIAGTDTISVSKNTGAVDAGQGSLASAGGTFTLGSGAFGTRIGQSLKTSDLQQIRGRALTLSVRVLATVANQVRVGLFSTGTGGTAVVSANHSGNSNFATLSVTYPAIPTDATEVIVMIQFGASGTFVLDNAMLVVGSVAADYAPLHPADDLARCQRYYEIIGETANSIQYAGYGLAASALQFVLPFKARKAVAPTTTKTGTWLAANCGQPAIASSGVDVVSAQITVTAAGNAGIANSSGGQYITIEGNP